MAALEQTGLRDCLHQVLGSQVEADIQPSAPQRGPLTSDRLLKTLLFLPVAGLSRPWDLRGYTGRALGLLTDREQAYGYEYVERYLAGLAKAGLDKPLTEHLCRWTSRLWLAGPSSQPPVFYVDGHHKPVYSGKLLPRGLVGKLGKILPCRGLVLLHDQAGHPLLITTGRGDRHLTVGLPDAVELYEQACYGLVKVGSLVVDREGMAGDFLSGLVKQNRRVITLLRKDQYADLTSFREVSPFTAWRFNKQADLTHQVAGGIYSLKVPETAGAALSLRAALIEDVRPQQHGETSGLIPVVSTWEEDEPLTMAELYRARWERQENIIKDWLLPVGLDINHGYAKSEVENSEVGKRRERLNQQLANCRKYGLPAREKATKASRTRGELHQQIYRMTRETDRLEGKLTGQIFDRGVRWEQAVEQAGQAFEIRQQRERLVKMRERREYLWDFSSKEHSKADQYQKREKQLLADLAELTAKERKMYELDNHKDQVMTCFKLALVNLGMWVREHYFPPSYRQVTWERLQPFFQMGGWIKWGEAQVEVELLGFNDREMNRDLAWVCDCLCRAEVKLADGRRLLLKLSATPRKEKEVVTPLAEADAA